MATKRIGLKEVRELQPGETVWDTSVSGFAIRRQAGVAVSYMLKYRDDDGRQRLYTIGRHGSPWTPDSARTKARELLGEVAKGQDPAVEKRTRREAETVAELCDAYWVQVETGRLLTKRGQPKKFSTLVSDKGRINNHIKPLLGRMKVTAVTQDDIEDFMHAVAEGTTASPRKPGERNAPRGGDGVGARTVGLLGAIFGYAVRRRMRSDNPVRGVARRADRKRDRRLTDTEYEALGHALRRSVGEGVWPATIAAARFLVLTGWRSGEALGMRWREVDLVRRTATLPDTKTGKSMRPLSNAACDILRGIGRGPDDALVFQPARGTRITTNFVKKWARIAALGELPGDITPHTLRHSFASLAADEGFSESTIAALIGHQGRSMTSRYIHSADAVLLAAADAVANETLARMGEANQPAMVIAIYS
jgi:integrase